MFQALFVMAAGCAQAEGVSAGRNGKAARHEFPTAIAAPKPEQAASTPAGALLEKALSALNTGNYDQALQVLQALPQDSADQAIREKAARLMADCYYLKGLKGDAQAFLTAAEQYKAILHHYPDPARGNDRVYYRLAACYEGLKFYYEAAGAMEKLVAIYPDSLFLPEVMFRLADLLRQIGKYNRAIERFVAYLNKYPEGKYAKLSHFSLGDCYYRAKRGSFAGKWYDEGWKRWPDFHDLPREILMNMGHNYFAAGKYASAYEVFSLYWNLYTGEASSRVALYRMGEAAQELGQIPLALKLYSLFIEKYPAASEAEECSLAMANLGVAQPGIKSPYYITDITGYREPLKTYDKLLAKNPEGEHAARILFFKGKALAKFLRPREAFAAYVQLLSKFPHSPYGEEGEKGLQEQAASLIHGYYEKGDFLAVADIYFQVPEKNFLISADFALTFAIAESLRKIGLTEEAGGLCEALLGSCKDLEGRNRVLAALAKIDLAKGRYDEAERRLVGLSGQLLRDSHFAAEVKLALADLYYEKKQWEKAAPLYAALLQNSAELEGLDRAYRNYGRVLMTRNMTQAAVNNYLRALKDYEEHPRRYHREIIGDIYMELGDAYCNEDNPEAGLVMYRKAWNYLADSEVKRWLLSRIGKAYAAQDDPAGAEKNFSQVKEAAEGEFWPKVADYFANISKSLARQGN